MKPFFWDFQPALPEDELRRAAEDPSQEHYAAQGRLAPLSKELYLSLSSKGQAVFRKVKAAEKYLAKLTKDYNKILREVAAYQDTETSNVEPFLPAQDTRTPSSYNAEVETTKESFEWAPFHRIPNVEKFTVKIGEKDHLFKHFGIDRRVPPVLEFTPYRNNQFIKYARFTIKRLRYASNDLVYWNMCHTIMSRSVVFNLMALNKSFDRYHRELPLHLVVRWLFGAMSVAKTWSRALKLTRIWIPKPNGKLRPLGVPSPVWRIHLTLLAWCLLTRFRGLVPDWQHGFLPKLGTLTAWRKILGDTIKANFIYEFDLKGFFDSVNVSAVLDWLHTAGGLSEEFRSQIEQYSKAPVISFKSMDPEDQPDPSDPTLRGVNTTNCLMDDEDEMEALLAAVHAQKGENAVDYYLPSGFPQGGNTSPLLSILQLCMVESPTFAKLVMYADDGLFYSDKEFDSYEVAEHFEKLGLSLAFFKSGWVRKRGYWLSKLKFLGLTYDPYQDRLSASTRNGSTLVFDKQNLVKSVESQQIEWPEGVTSRGVQFDAYMVWSQSGSRKYVFQVKSQALAKKLELETTEGGYWKVARLGPDHIVLNSDIDSPFTWKALARSPILGFIQNRLYNGSWNTNVVQNFGMTFVRSSWVAKRGPKVTETDGITLDFANSTSAAFNDVASMVKNIRLNAQCKAWYKSSEISLDQWNAIRLRIGWPKLPETWTKHLTPVVSPKPVITALTWEKQAAYLHRPKYKTNPGYSMTFRLWLDRLASGSAGIYGKEEWWD